MHEARVIAVAKAPGHGFSKQVTSAIQIIAGQGVEGDAHASAPL
jgi:hypothetical protein